MALALFYFLCFTNEENESEKLKNFPKLAKYEVAELF